MSSSSDSQLDGSTKPSQSVTLQTMASIEKLPNELIHKMWYCLVDDREPMKSPPTISSTMFTDSIAYLSLR